MFLKIPFAAQTQFPAHTAPAAAPGRFTGRQHHNRTSFTLNSGDQFSCAGTTIYLKISLQQSDRVKTFRRASGETRPAAGGGSVLHPELTAGKCTFLL